ncbi:MAG: 26S protease regulatory subunit, partial [Myxococcales bacterium]|nr:26S protease regulatory subunit [Myxococcales bacterium]
EEKKNAQVVNQLLTELDGFSKEDRNDIFIIAATNLLSSIDPAVIRPGRIDRKIKIGFPDEIARKAILGHYFSLAPAITHAKAQDYVRATRNWSAAEIKAFVNEARIHATIRNAQYVDKNDLNAALKKVQDSRAGR